MFQVQISAKEMAIVKMVTVNRGCVSAIQDGGEIHASFADWSTSKLKLPKINTHNTYKNSAFQITFKGEHSTRNLESYVDVYLSKYC